MHAPHDFFAAWPLFCDPALTGLFAGALLGGLGVFVLLGRMVFVSAALAQVASLGVAAGMVVRAHGAPTLGATGAAWCPAVGAALATASAGAALTLQARLRPRQLEAVLGLLFAGGSAGTLVLATYATADLHELQSLLFGSAVAVLPQARQRVGILCAALLSTTLLLLPALTEVWTDPQGARVRALPSQRLQAFLLAALAISIAYCTQTLGALPVFAFTVAPALAATARCHSVAQSFWVASLLGAFCGFVGYVLAFCMSWPVGATQALLAVCIAALAWAPAKSSTHNSMRSKNSSHI